jgi:hypothetical protein
VAFLPFEGELLVNLRRPVNRWITLFLVVSTARVESRHGTAKPS